VEEEPMRDGFTRRLDAPDTADALSRYLEHWKALLVVVSGGGAGSEIELCRRTTTIGRGPHTDLTVEDDSMSRQHAAIEFGGEGFRVRDLGSMNGVLVNGAEVKSADLKSGDQIQLGEHVFQLLIEARPHEARAYILPDD
jgi:pSer/pThr/pTyr-binding forkhead associated (FHA) protein